MFSVGARNYPNQMELFKKWATKESSLTFWTTL